MFARLFAPTIEVSAHCDLPCGVYDPAQARIEAESIKAIIGKVADNDDPDFRTRAVLIKEQRSELVKHHLWVLWTDYFKPPHFEKYPQLHTLVNEATKLAGATGTKGSTRRRRGRRAARQDRRDRRDLLGDQEGLSTAEAVRRATARQPPIVGRAGTHAFSVRASTISVPEGRSMPDNDVQPCRRRAAAPGRRRLRLRPPHHDGRPGRPARLHPRRHRGPADRRRRGLRDGARRRPTPASTWSAASTSSPAELTVAVGRRVRPARTARATTASPGRCSATLATTRRPTAPTADVRGHPHHGRRESSGPTADMTHGDPRDGSARSAGPRTRGDPAPQRRAVRRSPRPTDASDADRATAPATRWSTCTCRWSSTAPAGSATAASRSRTWSRSARSA